MKNRTPHFQLSAVLACFLYALPSAVVATEGDGVRVVLTGPGTPYARVEFSVLEKRGSVVATVSKTFSGPFGRREKVGLLAGDEFHALLEALAGQGAFGLPSRPHEGGQAVYTVELTTKGRHHRFEVADPELLDDPRYLEVIRRVRAVVGEHAGTIAFQDRMLLPGEGGVLRVSSTPPARVWLDDIALPGETPIAGLRVEAGPHKVRLQTATGLTETYEVKVDVGKTTSLNVELR